MDIVAAKKAITALIAGKQGEIAAIVEELYRFPETGLQEFKSAALLADILEREGFSLERGIAEMATAFRKSVMPAGTTSSRPLRSAPPLRCAMRCQRMLPG